MPSPNLKKPQRYTYADLQREFPDDAACLRALVAMLYPHGIHCLTCGEVLPHHQLKSRPRVWSCGRCGAHTHPTAGTPFHKSSTPLATWFHAIYLMASTRCGVSAMQVMRETGVTYKTAWRMFNLIRKMLEENISDLGGDLVVQADETYFGPKVQRMNRKARSRLPHSIKTGPGTSKTCVAGLLERGGRVVAYPVSRRGYFELTQPIKERVKAGSEIHTDEANLYSPLEKWGYRHRRVNHSLGMYVVDGVSTNALESFWSNTKRGIDGVYHHVSRKYLHEYLNEYTFRFNHRKDARPMFRLFCAQISSDFVERHFPQKHRPRKIA